MRASRRTRTATGLVLVPLLGLTGCSFDGAQSLPLPGGKGGGGYELKVEFDDVLDLVPQSAVKVDDVTVGRVEEIELDGYDALVTIKVDRSVQLPANTRASLRQTSLLGEKFVSLDRPDDASGRLEAGETIPIERTSRNTEIEELLSALSLVLNGGSLEQIQVINRELIAALEGREDKVKDVLDQLDAFVGGLDRQKAQIIRTLDALDRLTARLARERQVLATGLSDLPDGARVLADEREDLTAVLTGLEQLGEVATRVIRATQQATVADLKALTPILDQLNRAGKDLPDSLEMLTTYPFPRTVDQGIRGDYANLFVTVDLDLQNALGNVGIPPAGGDTAPSVPKAPAVPKAPVPELELPDVPGLEVGGLRVTASGKRDNATLVGLLLGGLA
jgi:phospholipid/cholesterol/gamma-HCH transport system substrate-binding protein